MPLSASSFSSALKGIKFPKTAADAEQAWTDAWKSYISDCTQIADSGSAEASAFKGAIAGAFTPTSSTTQFLSSFESAMTAGLTAAVLTPNSGVTLTPAPGPLGATASPASTDATPRDDLADKTNTWTKTWQATGIPPDFSGAGPLS